MDILITKAGRSKLQNMNLDSLPFGRHFSDHILEADYNNDGTDESFGRAKWKV